MPLLALGIGLLWCAHAWPTALARGRTALLPIALSAAANLFLLAVLDRLLLAPQGLLHWRWLALVASATIASRLSNALPGPRAGRARLAFVVAVVPTIALLPPPGLVTPGVLSAAQWTSLVVTQFALVVLLVLFAYADERWAELDKTAQPTARRLAARVGFAVVALLALYAPSGWLLSTAPPLLPPHP